MPNKITNNIQYLHTSTLQNFSLSYPKKINKTCVKLNSKIIKNTYDLILIRSNTSPSNGICVIENLWLHRTVRKKLPSNFGSKVDAIIVYVPANYWIKLNSKQVNE